MLWFRSRREKCSYTLAVWSFCTSRRKLALFMRKFSLDMLSELPPYTYPHMVLDFQPLTERVTVRRVWVVSGVSERSTSAL